MIRPRKTVAGEKAYSPPLEGRMNRIRLDFNENTLPLHIDPLTLDPWRISTYPEYSEFERKLAELMGLPERNILLFNGSGEAIFTTAFTFIEPGKDRAITSNPTFALIPHSLKLVGADLAPIAVKDDLSFDLEKIEAELNEGAKMAIFASPDNPTGSRLPMFACREWCRKFEDTLFVIDEAYQEYETESFLPLAGGFENCIVLRTFSKAWGMAGLRLGVAVGSSMLLDEMRKVRSPYSVNAAAIACAEKALSKKRGVVDEARSAAARKRALADRFLERGFKVIDCGANFFLIDAGLDAKALARFCESRGVLVRERKGIPGFSGAIRISTGTSKENQALLDSIDAFRASSCIVFDLDNTLVDTTSSYDEVVKALVQDNACIEDIDQALSSLRADGNFNNDWEAAYELIRRGGGSMDRAAIIDEGKAIYLRTARSKEAPLLPFSALPELGKRYRLFIYTGRPRDEYVPIWGDRLDPLFERVLCVDDRPDLAGKPAPDQLNALLDQQEITRGYYVGDNVDDMKAASDARLIPIGIATGTDPETLIRAGAKKVLSATRSILKEFGL